MTTNSHLLLTIGILSATMAAAALTDHRNPEHLARPLDSISSQIDGWTSGGNRTLQDKIVATLDSTEYLSRTYTKGMNALDVFAAFYAQQRAGESMHSPKYCLPGGGWEFSEFATATVPMAGTTAKINRAVIQKPGSRAIMFYWYQSRTRVVASEYQSKVFLVWDGLVHANPGGSIVRVMLPDRPDASEEGLAFAAQLVKQVQRCFHPE
jgi:EpsI family protein